MFDTFTEPARAAISRAQDEARGMDHGEIQVEHLLLGLLSHDSGLDRLWAQFGLTLQPARDKVSERLGANPGPAPEGDLPFSPDAQDALTSAHRLGMGEPGPAHILVVLIGRGEGGPSEILTVLGADPATVRFEAKKLMAPPSGAQTITTAGGNTLTGTTVSIDALSELDFGA
jgi:ATP-dependent Clp protease ATP-binding subunit ClpC